MFDEATLPAAALTGKSRKLTGYRCGERRALTLRPSRSSPHS
jgi:hypothetical protein